MAVSDQAYVPMLPRVRAALGALTSLKAERPTAGYLCVLNAATIERRTTNLRPNFRGFFDRFFRIGDPPSKKPYVVPFGATVESLLFNENVAGSYAPSSIRPVNALRSIIDIEGEGKQARYSLREDHAQLARKLLLPAAIPIYSFAVFMYRDVGFTENPDRNEIEQAVGDDFGFALDNGLYGSQIFSDDLNSMSAADFQMIGVD